MRATVDRLGADSHGRSTKVQVRRIRKGDLSRVRDVVEQAFGDYLERQLGTRPRQPFGGAQYVHHRWLMEPWGCFVAEEDQTKIVGASVGVTWGSLGLLGPVAVLTNYQNQKIGQQLIRGVEEFFEENKVALAGLVTYPSSPRHLVLFSKFGYRPKGLMAVMIRPVSRDAQALVKPVPRSGATVRKFSALEEAKKKAALARFHRITSAVCRGMDLSKEVEIVDGLALGDTLLLERGSELLGFAICHYAAGISEAPTGALYVKFLAIDPRHKRPEHLEQLLAAVEETAAGLGLARVIAPVYTRYWTAYTTLAKCGYQVDFTMVRMQRGKQEDYENPSHLVLDDWR